MGRRSDDNTHAELHHCPACRVSFQPWITSCPHCEIGLIDHRDQPVAAIELGHHVAAPLPPDEAWIDIPIPASEVGKTALLRQFLADHKIEYAESRRFISIPIGQAGRARTSIRSWRASDDQVEDLRHLDTLASTIAEIVATFVAAVDELVEPEPAADGPIPGGGAGSGSGIDLR